VYSCHEYDATSPKFQTTYFAASVFRHLAKKYQSSTMIRKYKELQHSQGFVLVVKLSLMVLLTVIAIGLLSLSSTSLRSSANGEAQSQAVANARMAVTMALGELQKEAGDDRRITADASLSKSSTQSHLLWNWSLLQKKIYTQTVRETNKVIFDGLCFATMRIDSPKLQKQ
jgi:hypothetical protein